MPEISTVFEKSKTSKIVLILSVFVSIFWILGSTINIYSYILVGAIFEMLWLPVIAMTYVLPIISFIFLFKKKFNLKSLYLYCILLQLITFLTTKFLIS